MKNSKTHRIATLGIFAAISILLIATVRIPFPGFEFLVYDPADIPIFIATFAFGPVSGFILTVVVSFIQGFLLGGDGIVGVVMHILATGVFTIIAGNIYKHNRTKKGAIKAMIVGVAVWISSMAAWNILVTPLYYGIDYETFWAVYFPAILIFNVIKAVVNGTVTMVVYKHVEKLIHRFAKEQPKKAACKGSSLLSEEQSNPDNQNNKK